MVIFLAKWIDTLHTEIKIIICCSKQKETLISKMLTTNDWNSLLIFFTNLERKQISFDRSAELNWQV